MRLHLGITIQLLLTANFGRFRWTLNVTFGNLISEARANIAQIAALTSSSYEDINPLVLGEIVGLRPIAAK
jgi:hypothetical protein